MSCTALIVTLSVLAGCTTAPNHPSEGVTAPAMAEAPELIAVPDLNDPGLISEINLMRRDPKAYADKLEAVAQSFRDGNSCRGVGEACVLALQGEHLHTIKDIKGYRASLSEAAAHLRSYTPLPALREAPILAAASYDHAQDLSDGRTDDAHKGKDGSWPRDRMERRGVVQGKIAENIMFGFNSAFAIVTGWLIDHGVSERGHRKNLLDPALRYVGSACGTHSTYRKVCVTSFAQAVGR